MTLQVGQLRYSIPVLHSFSHRCRSRGADCGLTHFLLYNRTLASLVAVSPREHTRTKNTTITLWRGNECS